MTPIKHWKESFPEKIRDKCDRLFGGKFANHCKVLPGNWTLSENLDLEAIKNFELDQNDVWIVTPPKCGTTWMQELVWLIRHNVDLDGAKINQFFRVPFLELESLVPPEEDDRKVSYYPENEEKSEETVRLFMSNSLEYARRMEKPRTIKTHLSLSILPDNLLDTCKVIFVGRNIKDATVSYYHHQKLGGYTGTFSEFAWLFRNDYVSFNPFMPLILEAWDRRHHPNMFFTTFEDMKADIGQVTDSLISFLGKDKSDINVDKLLSAVHIESFRANKFVNKDKEIPPDEAGNSFIRKGMVGDWRNYFTPDMNREWDQWIGQTLASSDYKMVFDQAQNL